MPLIKPPLVNLVSCHPRATCYIAQCCHLANSITCHARATGHMTGCCRLANSMSCHPKASKAKQRCVVLMGVGMCLYAHLNLQTKNKQSHVSYCRLQKFHLPFENRFSPYIRDEYWRVLEMWVRVRSKHWKYATIGQMAYEFLFVFHCKYGHELNVSLFLK